MSSKLVPGLKGVRCRISSEPQRPPCSVLHTMQEDRWKRGLKWNATSALGFTLLPQVKSTWNLEEAQDTVAGSEDEHSNTQQKRGSATGTTNLSALAGTEPWMTTISPGARPPRMVPLKGTDYGGQTDGPTLSSGHLTSAHLGQSESCDFHMILLSLYEPQHLFDYYGLDPQ